MTFLLEAVDTQARRTECASLGLISPPTMKPYHEDYKWVVDRERGLYFVNFGGGYSEKPWSLALVVKGVVSLKPKGG